MPSRRTALSFISLGLLSRGAVAGAAAATLTACRGSGTGDPSPAPATPSPGAPGGRVTVRPLRVPTGHWPGGAMDATMLVPSSPARALVVALHGNGMTGASMVEALAIADHLEATRLAVIAPSGGRLYWHARRASAGRAAADPGRGVVEDVIPAGLAAAGLPAGAAVGFLGLSMGGYGSLLLASDLGPQAVFGVVAESAALWTDPGMSAPGAFDDRADFERHDVFTRAMALRDIPIRLDCGTEDPFVEANRVFAREVVPHAEATFDAGGHDTAYWRSHAGAQLSWLADRAATRG